MTETIKARLLETRVIRPTQPFHFEGTFHKPSHFPSNDNAYESGMYWQTVNFRGVLLGLKFSRVDDDSVELKVFGNVRRRDVAFDDLENEMRWRFDLDADLREFNAKFASDRILGPVLQRWSGMRVSCGYSLYEFLIVAVLLQNATVRRSVQMLDILFRTYGSCMRFDGRELCAFWQPSRLKTVSEDELRSLKVGYRARTIDRLTEHFTESRTDEFALRGHQKDEVKDKLLELYGIGPASVGMLLFEVFHHYDAFDVISPWEQKIYSRLLFSKELVDVEEILKTVRRRWGKWRMLASHYIFEDLFWRRRSSPVPWLEELIRL